MIRGDAEIRHLLDNHSGAQVATHLMLCDLNIHLDVEFHARFREREAADNPRTTVLVRYGLVSETADEKFLVEKTSFPVTGHERSQ